MVTQGRLLLAAVGRLPTQRASETDQLLYKWQPDSSRKV